MTMVPRDPITTKQIDAAKGKVTEGDGPPGSEDTDAVAAAQVKPAGAPKLPVRK